MKVKFIRSIRNLDGLTYGKIYEVIHIYSIDINSDYNQILIKNDFNQEIIYYMKYWFEDVTAEIREDKLKELGI